MEVLTSCVDAMISSNLVPRFLKLMTRNDELQDSDLCREILFSICRSNLNVIPVDFPTIQLFQSFLPTVKNYFDQRVPFYNLILHFANSDPQLVIDSGILMELMDQPKTVEILSCFVRLSKSAMEKNDKVLFYYLMGLGLFPYLVNAMVDFVASNRLPTNFQLQLAEIVKQIMCEGSCAVVLNGKAE
jgi:hypothetical protein